MYRRVVIACSAIVLVATVLWFSLAGTRPSESNARLTARTDRTTTSGPADSQSAATDSSIGGATGRSLLADDLNTPSGTIAADLKIVDTLLEAFRSNFPHSGNPVGENSDITAALTGRNSLALAIVPPAHPAINARGELCDRWSTPFFFHQLSGSAMEIRSAGPDRKFRTADDSVFEP